MRILSINTFGNTGGAAIAVVRVLEALDGSALDVRLLSHYNNREHKLIIRHASTAWNQLDKELRLLYENAYHTIKGVKWEYRYAFSSAVIGLELSTSPYLQDADIIHLNWLNRAYISLDGLDNILALNKPVIWTLHDMWAFTGGCHYSGTCEAYLSQCGNCPMLKGSGRDLSAMILERKKRLFHNKSIQFVTCTAIGWLVK